MHIDQRGLRFKFSAEAEVHAQDLPTSLRGRITDLSLQGCFLAISCAFGEKERVRVKIFRSGECVESLAEVIYQRPSGVGLLFVEMIPRFREVLQNWILSALDRQIEESVAK